MRKILALAALAATTTLAGCAYHDHGYGYGRRYERRHVVHDRWHHGHHDHWRSHRHHHGRHDGWRHDGWRRRRW